jgi:beta-lactamase superfamily II metal-dependent hydrolase
MIRRSRWRQEDVQMFRIDVLPAEFGDALWIEYGNRRKPRRILIDCGTEAVYRDALRTRIEALKPSDRHFELFVVTHVDIDHIGGALEFLADAPRLGVRFTDVWFNGYRHLQPRSNPRGALQGEELTSLILAQQLRWNGMFGGGAIVVPDGGALPSARLAGGMKLTLLSPTPRQLLNLEPEWEKTCRAAGLIPGQGRRRFGRRLRTMLARAVDSIESLANARFTSDTARPNGSSIALLAEYDGRRIVLGADAHAPVLLSSLRRLSGGAPLKVDAFKLPHHGSRNNTSIDLVRAVNCRHWIVSTNGKLFRHPDREAISRVALYGGTDNIIHFNYLTRFNEMWKARLLARRYRFTANYPASAEDGLGIDL